MKTCNSCLCLKAEPWPRGTTAVRCMNPAKPVGGIGHYGRVVELFRFGEVGTVLRPSWCPASDWIDPSVGCADSSLFEREPK